VSCQRLISGHPLVGPEAEKCIKQWAFRPRNLKGEPVEVTTQMRLTFTLAK
jgi:outer membrane biosynthesis protein TonB